MSKKMVGIGGGDNGYNGTPYETGPFDQEIIKLTGKEKPNYLLIAHSQPLERQENYFKVMKDIYLDMYDCPCRDLKSDELSNIEVVKEKIEWADIIFEGGGNTLDMIKLWKDTGFDRILKDAWESGKVMCGVSAGANCWFEKCSTDSLKILYGDDQPLIGMDCLGFYKGFFVPHCDEPGRRETVKDLIDENTIGILVSNCAALEIVDDKYRILTSDGTNHGIEPYALKTYWHDGKYYEESIDLSLTWKDLDSLYTK